MIRKVIRLLPAILLTAWISVPTGQWTPQVEAQHTSWCNCSACSGGTADLGVIPPSQSTDGAQAFGATQVVFLDFDTGTDGSIVYGAADRATIAAGFDTVYAPWDFTFVTTAPGVGPFSTIFFNAGGPGGLAEHIDFGNTDMADDAVVNIDGLGLGSMAAINQASINIGTHELGHLLGLRHGDSYGPIGSGIHAPPGAGAYLPAYPGPAGAVETTDHIMASPASVGSTLGDATTPSWFSERSAIKLTANETPSVFTAEAAGPKGTIGTAQALSFTNLTVPNTILAGANAGMGPFNVDAVAVLGELTTGTETDFYSFMGSTGDLMNIELLSAVNSWKPGQGDVLDSLIRVVDGTGTVIPYYAGTAENDDEFESFDSIFIDLLLPGDGMFFIEVDRSGFAPGDTGNYELFVSRFNGVIPEPGSAALLALGMMGLALNRRRRRA